MKNDDLLGVLAFFYLWCDKVKLLSTEFKENTLICLSNPQVISIFKAIPVFPAFSLKTGRKHVIFCV